MHDQDDYISRLAKLIVEFGANVQPGQVVSLSSEPSKEVLARAVAEAAYRRGALFVDQSVFDVQLKRLRALYADPETLSFVPEWYGERVRGLAARRGAAISFAGVVAPEAMQGIDPALVGRDMLPSLRETKEFVDQRTVNWTVAPCPNPGWASIVHPDLEPAAALAQLWREVAHVCRLDEPDPVAAWEARMARLTQACEALNALALDGLHFEGPGTDLRVGLLPGSRWLSGKLATVEGIEHAANLPTEEVFTTPDPERVEGVVTSTKPLFASGNLITGLRVRFEAGRAVEIDADQGAGTLRTASQRDSGAARLGEVALVDRESRIGSLGAVFYDTLLDENAASHIALGHGLEFCVEGEDDKRRINHSEIHIDFMIGSDQVTVSGTAGDGREVELLRGGVWQI
jgi:aminopeptidase